MFIQKHLNWLGGFLTKSHSQGWVNTIAAQGKKNILKLLYIKSNNISLLFKCITVITK